MIQKIIAFGSIILLGLIIIGIFPAAAIVAIGLGTLFLMLVFYDNK